MSASTPKTQEPKLDFRAITPGLGFHPFSDGLPYAPVSKTVSKVSEQRSFTGTGAVAAGPARYAAPVPPRPAQQPTTPKINVPVAKPLNSTAAITDALRSPQIAAAATTAITPGTKVSDAIRELDLQPSYGFLYLCKRVLAYLLDSSLNTALCVGGLGFVLVKQQIGWQVLFNPGTIAVTFLFLGVFNWALITAQEIAFGTSIGKRIFGLVLRGSTSALFIRAFFFLPSLWFCAGGVLWGLFDRNKRCWHDLVVNVQPAELAEL